MTLVARVLLLCSFEKARQVFLTSLLFVCVLLVAACDNQASVEPLHYRGETMGTTYHITLIPEAENQLPEELAQEIQKRLDAVNQSMSTYLPDSELSKVNRSSVGTWLEISGPLFTIIRDANEYSRLSNGALDVTVAPIVDLWGFGPLDRKDNLPSEEEIAEALAKVGFTYIELDEATLSIKKNRELSIDLSSIAKGYGSDTLGAYFKELGLKNYLLEIGGDLLVAGSNGRGSSWRIGVERPSMNHDGVQQAIAVSNVGIATSGDYRNFFNTDGESFSHIIDPRTGRPVKHNLVSVTVVAKTAREADALATAMTVLGADAALDLAEKEGLAVYLIENGDAEFTVRYSTKFKDYLN